MTYPHAYHITWGTYGVRLPGSDRPHVTKDHNTYGSELPDADLDLEELARRRMKQSAVRLTMGHRRCVDLALNNVAIRYNWVIHASAPQCDHVHVVVTANRVGPDLRDALKAVTCRALNKQFLKQNWWAQGGSCKYLYEDSYFANAVRYVKSQREI